MYVSVCVHVCVYKYIHTHYSQCSTLLTVIVTTLLVFTVTTAVYYMQCAASRMCCLHWQECVDITVAFPLAAYTSFSYKQLRARDSENNKSKQAGVATAVLAHSIPVSECNLLLPAWCECVCL